MYKMKKILTTLASVLCCALAMTEFTSCIKTDEEVRNELVGTWKDENDAYTDILTLGEDEQFSFRSHLQSYNGSGFYKFESGYRQSVWGTGINDYRSEKVRMLFLHFSGRETETLEIKKINSNKLELVDRYGNVFRFQK